MKAPATTPDFVASEVTTLGVCVVLPPQTTWRATLNVIKHFQFLEAAGFLPAGHLDEDPLRPEVLLEVLFRIPSGRSVHHHHTQHSHCPEKRHPYLDRHVLT